MWLRGELMKKNRNCIKILTANKISVLSILCLGEGIFACILQIKEDGIYRLPYILIFVFVSLIIYCMMNIWKNWIVQGKCDFEAQETYILKLLGRKRYRDHVGLHLALLFTSLGLGRYDESRREIERLHRLYHRLNDKQKLQLQLWKIDYMISINESAYLKKELEDAEKILKQLKNINIKLKQRMKMRIRLRHYLIEDRWKDVLELLEDISKSYKSASVFEQVVAAYIRGICYYRLDRYEEAFHELGFVIRRGGNTKYVALANDLLEKIPEKNKYEDRYEQKSVNTKCAFGKMHFLLAVNCFIILLLCIVIYYFSHGNSIEEAYCRRYLCAEDELTVFYQKDIDDYEMVILHEEEKMAYCLFRETKNSGYQIIDSFRMDPYTGDDPMELMWIEMTESEKESYQRGRIELEIWEVITGFYQKNNIFYQDDLTYAGISYSPMVENIVINGNPVRIEQIIDIGETQLYLWRAEYVNLEEYISVKSE